MGGDFNTLSEWHFDEVRVKKERGFVKNPNYKKILEREMLDYELGLGNSEIIDIFLPPTVPNYTMKIFNILSGHISLIRGEFGMGFRESRANLKSILKSYKIDYRICKTFIDDFENRLIKQHINGQEK